MTQWVIFFNPTDYPGKYVLRRFQVGPGTVTPEAEPDGVFETLEDAREVFRGSTLVRIERDPNDEPQIVETWL